MCCQAIFFLLTCDRRLSQVEWSVCSDSPFTSSAMDRRTGGERRKTEGGFGEGEIGRGEGDLRIVTLTVLGRPEVPETALAPIKLYKVVSGSKRIYRKEEKGTEAESNDCMLIED